MGGKRNRASDKKVSPISKRSRSPTNAAAEILRPWLEGKFLEMDSVAVLSLFADARKRHDEWTKPIDKIFRYRDPVGWGDKFHNLALESQKAQTGRDLVVSMIAFSFGYYKRDDFFSPHERRLNFLDPKKMSLIDPPERCPETIKVWVRDAYTRRNYDPEFLMAVKNPDEEKELDLFISNVTRVFTMTTDEIDKDETIPYKGLVVEVANAVRSEEGWRRADEDTRMLNLIHFYKTVDHTNIYLDYED